MRLKSPYVVNFSEVGSLDEELLGKKIHELGILQKLNIPLPGGFVITTEFFKEFLRLTGIDEEIRRTNALNHPALINSIDKLYFPTQKKIMETPIPQDLAAKFHLFYRHFFGSKNKSMNIFSSAFNNKSIAFSDISGDANLVLKIKKIWSLFFREPIAILVQENIKPEIKGKISTNNPNLDKVNSRLKNYCQLIQKAFYFPKEVEYVVSNAKIYITKISPFTGTVDKSPKVLAKGISVNLGIFTGPVKVLSNQKNVKILKGEVIVLPKLEQSMFAKIKNAKAVVVDSVLLNPSEKFFYKRNFKIPTVEGIKNATKLFHNGNIITVNGLNGKIYSGGLIY